MSILAPTTSTEACASRVEPHWLGFVVAGAQKSGTTTLSALLRLHPDIQMASVKETHFFDDESVDWNDPDYRVLHNAFSPYDGRLRGEATPISMYWPPSVDRICRYNPGIRFVLILRNPIRRAYSQWQMEVLRGAESLPFSVAIREGRERVRQAQPLGKARRTYSYVERGFYAAQLKRIIRLVPSTQIHCEIFEHFFLDPVRGLARITGFLGLSQTLIDLPTIHEFRSAYPEHESQLDEVDRRHLAELFRDDVDELRVLLGRTLQEWKEFTSI